MGLTGFPVFFLSPSQLVYYYKDQYVYEYNMATGKEKPVLATSMLLFSLCSLLWHCCLFGLLSRFVCCSVARICGKYLHVNSCLFVEFVGFESLEELPTLAVNLGHSLISLSIYLSISREPPQHA